MIQWWAILFLPQSTQSFSEFFSVCFSLSTEVGFSSFYHREHRVSQSFFLCVSPCPLRWAFLVFTTENTEFLRVFSLCSSVSSVVRFLSFYHRVRRVAQRSFSVFLRVLCGALSIFHHRVRRVSQSFFFSVFLRVLCGAFFKFSPQSTQSFSEFFSLCSSVSSVVRFQYFTTAYAEFLRGFSLCSSVVGFFQFAIGV